MKKSIILTILVLFYVVILFLGTLVPAKDLGAAYRVFGIGNDNILHFFSFFFLAMFLHLVFVQKMYRLKSPLLWTFFVGLSFSVIGELLQLTQSTRHATFFDFALNTSGIIVYILLAKTILPIIFVRPLKPRSVDE